MTDEKAISTERALKQALEALELAKRSYGMMLLSDPPQEAWKTYRVDDAISKAITALREALTSVPDWASEAKEQPAKDEFKAAYIEAMVASNEAGFAGMSAAETIRELSRMVAEQPAPATELREQEPLTDEQYFEIGQRHWLPSIKVEKIHKEIIEAARGIKGDA